ncbi:MAG: dienelactone hydrolase family protein [Isosphaeraceae bacterium]
MVTQGTNGALKERFVEIAAGRSRVRGILSIPPEPRGVVAFAHGSGSGRFSPRNLLVARVLQDAGLVTLLIDLLEGEESHDPRNAFDVDLLAERLDAATHWLGLDADTRGYRLGYFAASTGAAAALMAAARRPEPVAAVVSRGGRPDLAWVDLPDVIAPTLLIAGGHDDEVRELNRRALTLLRCPKELVVIPGSTHLFEESGALEQVAVLAERWFLRHLGPDSPSHRDPSKTSTVEPVSTIREPR